MSQKLYDHTCNNTIWRIYILSLTTFQSTIHNVIEILFILKAVKSHFKVSYDKQNLTTVVISLVYDPLYQIYKSRSDNDHLCKILYIKYTEVGQTHHVV